jgi:DNA-binding CsgD family transcriptional regulator
MDTTYETRLIQLTPGELRVAQHLVAGLSNPEGAALLGIGTGTFSSHLGSIGDKFHAFARPHRAHAVLASGQVTPPPSTLPVPALDESDLIFLRALAEHSNPSDIARAAGAATASVRSKTGRLVRKAGASNATHLIGLAHTWGFLQAEGRQPPDRRRAPTGWCPGAQLEAADGREGSRDAERGEPVSWSVAAPASHERAAQPPPVPVPPVSVYEVHTLGTDAEREEAAALVQDRQHWLTMRGLPVAARPDVPALFRDPQTTSAGLFDDGELVACMIPERDPGLGWGEDQCLFLDCVHTLPGRPDDITLLITLWVSDFAARLGLPLVRAEVLARHPLEAEPVAALLCRLIDMGWDVRGSGPGREGDRIARLELAAERRSGLGALISCRVHEPHTAQGDRGSA